MKSKRKGNILEAIVLILEKALQTNPETKLFPKHKLPDRHGILREHDVYVETIVNRKLLKYSFECKNFNSNSKIKMSHIDEFNAKIAETDIKGIFVSTAEFQPKAIEKAKKLSIDVYGIRPVKDEKKPVRDIQFFKKEHHVGNIQLYVGEEHCQMVKEGKLKMDTFYEGSKKKPLSMEKFDASIRNHIDKAVKANLAKLFHKFFKIDEDGLQMKGGFTDSYQGVFELMNYFYKVGDKYFYLRKASAEVVLTQDRVHVPNPDGYCVVNLLTDEEIVFYSSVLTKYMGEDLLINCVKVPGEKFLKYAAVNPNKPLINDLKFEKPILLKDVSITIK
jgi:hypothetical protein